MNNISVSRVSEKDFSNMRSEWNTILEESVTNEVFLSWEWVYSWWDVYKKSDRKLYILVGRNSKEEIIGIAPFYIEKNNIFGISNRKVIRFCSSVETYPDHLDLICEKNYGDSFPEAVFKYFEENKKEWDVIKLDGVKESSLIKNYLTNKEQNIKNIIIDCTPESDCPYLDINQSFDNYLKSFSRKKRSTLLRKRKILLERENLEYKTLSSTEEVDKYMRELFILHAERAERKGIKTNFSGNKIYNFHKKFITYLLENKKIIISFLFKDSTPFASYYCINHNNKYYYYQAGLSYDGEKKSAGSVLLSLNIENAFNEGCKEFDFLRGSEKFKYFWTKQYRQNYSIIIRKNDYAGSIFYKTSSFKNKLKMIKKSFLN